MWRMRYFMTLVTLVLLMTTMLVVTMGPALAVVERFPKTGTPLPTEVCESPVVASQLIGWSNGTCWIFHPVSVTDF